MEDFNDTTNLFYDIGFGIVSWTCFIRELFTTDLNLDNNKGSSGSDYFTSGKVGNLRSDTGTSFTGGERKFPLRVKLRGSVGVGRGWGGSSARTDLSEPLEWVPRDPSPDLEETQTPS